MKIAPLIHSRTGQCDYNSKFAVRPNGFSEIQWARSKILAATRNIDRFNGIRRIVAAKNGVCIAGLVCTMKYFINNCLTGADKDAAQPYIDVHGRLYGVFLGYAFKGNANEIPIVNSSDLWQWFKEYLMPEWEKKSARTVEVDYLSWDKVKSAHVTNYGTEFYDSAAFNEESLFEEYLSRALTEEVAFCSNVENIQAVEDGIYTAVTTSASNITKLKENIDRKRREREEQERLKQEEQERQKRFAEAEKKTIAPDPQEQFDKSTPPKLTEQHIEAHQPSQSTPNVLKWLLIILLLGLIVFVVTKFFTTQNEEDDSKFNSLLEKRLTYCLNMN